MNDIKKYLPLGAAAAGALAILLALALPAMSVHGDSQSGWETVFVAEYMATVLTMPFLTVLLAVAGIALSVYTYLRPGNKMLTYAAIGCFAVAGIFFFCWTLFYCNAAYQEYAKEAIKEFKLGIGCILGGVLSLIAAAASAAPVFLGDK